MDIRVGTKLKLSTGCLGNEAGTVGVCYEVYTLGNRPGYSFIFPNGNYDGFSNGEVELFFEDDYMEYDKTISDYNFRHVIKLMEDYRNGVFDNALNI